jgi:hypothetical protein
MTKTPTIGTDGRVPQNTLVRSLSKAVGKTGIFYYVYFHWLERLLRIYLKKALAPIINLLPGDRFSIAESCEKCGVKQPLCWQADDAFWKETNGTTNGVLCPRCFTEIVMKKLRAAKPRRRALVIWEPHIEYFDD